MASCFFQLFFRKDKRKLQTEKGLANLENLENDHNGVVVHNNANQPRDIHNEEQLRYGSLVETGQSSNTKDLENDEFFICKICDQTKYYNELITIKNCVCKRHYCFDCIVQYTVSKIEEGNSVIRCFGDNCVGVLEVQDFMEILPRELIEKWSSSLCKNMVLRDRSVYCPFKDCFSLILIDDVSNVSSELKCPHCHRSICVQCQAPWHLGINCEDFRRLKRDGKIVEVKDSAFVCAFCLELKPESELFRVRDCKHCYCSECMAKYVTSKIEKNETLIRCPESDCVGVLELEYCRTILPSEVFDQGVNSLCESLICTSEKIYCPFKDCAALIFVDDDGEVVAKERKCPHCHRIFCTICRVPWHLGINCDEFQNLKIDETYRGEVGQSSDPVFDCEICTDTKPESEVFRLRGCEHSYCAECMANYVVSKIEENVTSISCPESKCMGVLELEFCRPILPREVFDRWGKSLCESLIPTAQKFYCPFKDCSALILDDGGVMVNDSECPHCRRVFCAQCKIPWHTGFKCEEIQKLGDGEREKDDIMLMKLAKDNKWQRCPKCKYYVERKEGCLYMKCRCKYAFCYQCGSEIKGEKHFCTKCNRTW